MHVCVIFFITDAFLTSFAAITRFFLLQGSIFRSQLSNSNKAPVHLPLLPQVHYQQFCQAKAVHCSSDGTRSFQGLMIEQINLPERDPAPHLINRKDALPPIRKRSDVNENKSVKSSQDEADSHISNNGGEDGKRKWNENCKCTRCKLMKSDYEVVIDDRYDHWGQYPCVPDAIINRDEQASSVDSGERREKDPDK